MATTNLVRRWTGTSLVLRIFIGLVVGAVLGLLLPRWSWIGIPGSIFVWSLKAIAPILVCVLVISAIARAGKGLGGRFRTVILLYLMSTLVAAFVAVGASHLFPVSLTLEDAAHEAAPGSLKDVFDTLLLNLVANPVAALASANYIGILFWSVLAGLALKLVASAGTIKAVGDIADALTLIVKLIIEFAPFGILGLVFSAVSTSGLEVFTVYGRLVLLPASCMLLNACIFNPLLSWICCGKNPYPLLWKCLKESGIPAFFTRSSAANIPVNLNLCKKLGLDEDFYSVSIPLGATVNMNGAAATITVMSLAVAHTVGVEVGFVSSLILSIGVTLAACGTSGVAGGSLLLIPMACSFIGIGSDVAMQAVAVGFIIGVIQDSIETALNSSADVFFTATAEYREWRGKKA